MLEQSEQMTASSDAEECSKGLPAIAPDLAQQSSEQAATCDGMLLQPISEDAACAPAAPKQQNGLSSFIVREGAPQVNPTSPCHEQQQVSAQPALAVSYCGTVPTENNVRPMRVKL